MIGAIYAKLFDYGDRLKEEGRDQDLEIVHECQRLVHEAYYEAEKVAQMVTDKEPESMVEKYVLSIPGIKVYYDIIDSVYYYELNELHFDKPGEVLKYLIKTRQPQKYKDRDQANRAQGPSEVIRVRKGARI